MSLRDHLTQPELFAAATASIDQSDTALVVDMCLAIKTDFAGEFLAQHIGSLDGLPPEKLSEYLAFAARYAAADRLKTIAQMAQQRFNDNAPFQEQLLRSVRTGLQQRGSKIPAVVTDWANQLAWQYLGMTGKEDVLPKQQQPISWTYLPYPGAPDNGNPWLISKSRKSADGQQASILHSSFPKGETHDGHLSQRHLSVAR